MSVEGRNQLAVGYWVNKAKKGDPIAFRALYRQLAPSLFAVAIGEEAPEPNQATAKILERIFDNLRLFVGDHADLAVFAYRTARFQLTDEARLRSRAVDPDPANGSGLEGQPHRSASDDPINTQSLQFLSVQANKLLSSTQREVLALRVYFDLSQADAARALGRSEEEIEATQARIHQRFASLATG